MLLERALERVAPVDRRAGGDDEIGEAALSHHARQGVLEHLKPRQKAVRLDRDARAGGRCPDCCRSAITRSRSTRLPSCRPQILTSGSITMTVSICGGSLLSR